MTEFDSYDSQEHEVPDTNGYADGVFDSYGDDIQEPLETKDDEVETTSIPNFDSSRYYIDDNHLTQILTEWKLSFYDEDGKVKSERPRIPEAVGAAFYDMAEQMGRRFNFSQYTYLSEMKSDGILNCVKYIHNFNPFKKSEKKGKPSGYGYINMIIWRSFTNRIKYEKQQQYLKYKSFEIMGGMDSFQDEELNLESGDDGSVVSMGTMGHEFMKKIAEYENEYMQITEKKAKQVSFDDFMFRLDEEIDESLDETYIEDMVEMEIE